MYENIDSLQEIRVTIEGKVLVFQERSSTVCREIFSEGVRCAQKPDLGDSRLFYVTRQVELQGKTNFARNHDVTTAAVPRENVKNMLCIKKQKTYFYSWLYLLQSSFVLLFLLLILLLFPCYGIGLSASSKATQIYYLRPIYLLFIFIYSKIQQLRNILTNELLSNTKQIYFQ